MANEKRLIDANALLENLGEEPMVWSDGEAEIQERNDWQRFKACVEAQDTVDAVEVVRCKDCIHWYEADGVCLKIYSDGAVSPYAWQDRKEDDFCSYGERKDNEN